MYKNRIMWKWYTTKADFWHIVHDNLLKSIRIAANHRLFKIGYYLCDKFSIAGKKFEDADTKAIYYAKLLREAAFE